MSQNRSSAVMQQRREPDDSLDFFPTPPWATRALCEHVLPLAENERLGALTVWEPACGEGDMARPLAEYFADVRATDVHAYGFGGVEDFLFPIPPPSRPHWIVTNPPFRLGNEFAQRALTLASRGVALFVRSAFLEGQERYKMFSAAPPAIVAQFVERVPLVKGRTDRNASSATAYSWVVWRNGESDTRFRWIPPCRKHLDRDTDWPAAESTPRSPA